MIDKEKYDFIDHVVHLTLFEEDRLLNEHGGDYSELEEDGIDSNEYYRIITERVINTLKKNNNYMQEDLVSEGLETFAKKESEAFAEREYEIGYIDRNALGKGYYWGCIDGAEWQKNKMMQNTIDARCFGFQGAALFSFRLPADNYLVGSKVKVIVIKDD